MGLLHSSHTKYCTYHKHLGLNKILHIVENCWRYAPHLPLGKLKPFGSSCSTLVQSTRSGKFVGLAAYSAISRPLLANSAKNCRHTPQGVVKPLSCCATTAQATNWRLPSLKCIFSYCKIFSWLYQHHLYLKAFTAAVRSAHMLAA